MPRQEGGMEYSILRGADRIGENLIEIFSGDTKILVELGKSLEGGDDRQKSAVQENCLKNSVAERFVMMSPTPLGHKAEFSRNFLYFVLDKRENSQYNVVTNLKLFFGAG